jgi:hypothetical protein
MGSFSGSKSTSTSGPAAYTQPYVQNALDLSQQTVNQQQPSLDAYGAIAGYGGAALAPGAFQTSPYVDNAQGAARAISNGAFLGGNPGQATYDRLQNPAIGSPTGGMMMAGGLLGGAGTPSDGPSSVAANNARNAGFNGGGAQGMPMNGGGGAIGSPTGGMRVAGGPMAANDPSMGLLTHDATNKTPYAGTGTLQTLAANGGNNPADAYATSVARGQYLNHQPSAGLYSQLMSSDALKGNPFLDNIIAQTDANVTKQANQRFGASGLGAGISTAYGNVLSSNLANNEGQLRYQNYNDAANRQLQAAGQSDTAFNNERGQMSNQTGLLASDYNAGQDRSLAAAQALNQGSQAQQAQQLAAAQALGGQYTAGRGQDIGLYNAGQDRALSAATQSDAQRNAQVQQMLQALGLTGQLSDAQYAGVDPTVKALTAGATLPLLGTDEYTKAIAALTGATNTSTSTTKGPGIGASLLGGLASGAGSALVASDRRLKTNIAKVGELQDGLGVYDFDYIDQGFGSGRQRGVMADEVARLRPWALGPKIDGEYATVHYGRL